MRWLTLIFVGASVFFCLTSVANAFGLKTHLWIGQELLADIMDDCRVNIRGKDYDLPADVCDAIRTYPGAFLAGNLGPDVYPDFITGQVTTHPGIDGDWQTKDWLRNLYQDTIGKELAFAAGYICHASADVFAHTYVNAYAGDIFILMDERRVELRHFVLEKYIDYHLPLGEPNPDTMEIPAEFLRDRLIYNEDAARLSVKSGAALHISAMYGVWRNVTDLDRELDKLDSDAAQFLVKVIGRLSDEHAKLADGETALDLIQA